MGIGKTVKPGAYETWSENPSNSVYLRPLTINCVFWQPHTPKKRPLTQKKIP